MLDLVLSLFYFVGAPLAIVVFFYVVHRIGGGTQTNQKKEVSVQSQVRTMKVLLGAPFVGLVGYLYAGDDFFQLVLYSVICTLGGAGLLWAALCYGIGSVVYSISLSIKKKNSSNSEGQVFFTDRSSRNQMALIDYIQKSLAYNVPITTIRQNLENAGWQATDIDAVMAVMIQSK